MDWIPLWVDKWIFGTTRIELAPDERSVWVDLMALGAKDNGFIRANEGVSYPGQQLAGLLCITEELLNRTIQRCLDVDKLKKCENGGGYYISNWAEYQLSDRHKRRFKQNIDEGNHVMSAETDIMAENENKSGSIGYKEEDIKKRKGKDIDGELKIFGEFSNVKLKDEEFKKLVEKFGELGAKERIENLSRGIASKGYKYKSHYATILSWEKKNPLPINPESEKKSKPAMIKCKFCNKIYTLKDGHQCKS